MPKLRDTDDIDVEELESVEYSTERLVNYAGEVPPIGLTLSGYVRKIWWARTKPKPNGGGDDPMLKVLWIASDNDGDNEEYNECPFWLNAPLTPGAKFRWDPFLNAYGLSLTDVKTRTYVDKDADQNGIPIQRIGTWKPGAENDSAWCWVVTGQENDDYGLKAIADEWLPWDEAPEAEAPEDEDEDEDEPDEPEDEPDEPEDYEDEEPEDEEPEDEVPEEPPARTRKARAAATSRSPRTASTARSGRAATSGRSARAGAATGRTARSAGARAATAKTGSRAAKPPARSTRTKRPATGDNPPF